MNTSVRIATRESALALWQARHVADALKRHHPDLAVSLLPMTTEGDRHLGSALFKIGGKGLFLKELERAMLDGDADIAVHSMKDVPAALPDGLHIGAVLERADPRDALLSTRWSDIDALPANAVIGTCSLRRQCQLRAYRKDLKIRNLRGNIDTRVKRLDDGDFDAIVLATAGLQRLGLDHRITGKIDTSICLPAIGQGVIGIECRDDDTGTAQLLEVLDHGPTSCLVAAERAVSEALRADCHLPVAAHAEFRNGSMRIRGIVGTPDGSRLVRADAEGSPKQAESLGQTLGDSLLQQGADAILAELKADPP